MIQPERIEAFIRSMDQPESPVLGEIRKNAIEKEVPIIRSETASFLRFLVALKKPKKILEVGCAVGYSAICMGEYMPEGGHITTMEKFEPRIPEARENFKKAGMEEKITLLEGDATEILERLEGTYDLIFMDAAKAQYIVWLPEVMRLLAPDGILISDNVLQDGDVMESRFAVTRRNRTIHSRMREYLYTLTHTEGLVTSIIPIGDGVTVSTRRETNS